MFGTSFFGRAMDMSRMTLGVGTMREKVIANNIANVDTPNYKRQELTFEAQLNRAIQSETQETVPQRVTDSRHIAFDSSMNFRQVVPKVHVEFDTNMRNDKNNVDIEKEISDEVKNEMQYNAVTTSVNNSYRRLRTAFLA